jgi:peptidoglycan/xylan/chitin deacetylase (PgdA/CDA1 family)
LLRRWAIAVLAIALLSGCGGSPAGDAGSAGRASDRGGPDAPAREAHRARTDLAAVSERANVPVLCYHQIRSFSAGDGEAARPYIVAPAVLARQLGALARAGYRTVTGDQLIAHVARGAPLPPKPVLITFDDASAGQFRSALPLLRRNHFVATFFVMTVVLDKPGWLTRRQVHMLDRAGMTIGAHTWDHHAVPEYTGGDWRQQIDQPTRELAQIVGHPIRLFAYPFGLWSAAAIPHLWSAGFTGAFQLAGALDRRHPLWNLRRIIVPEWSGRRLLREIRRDF